MIEQSIENVVKSVSDKYLFSEFNSISESLITDLKETLNNETVNLSYQDSTGNVDVEFILDGKKITVNIANWK